MASMATSQSMPLSSIAVISVILLLVVLRSVPITSVDCDSGRGECLAPSNCEPFKLGFSFTRFKFCDQTLSTICCPKRKQAPNVFNQNLTIPAVRACKEYRDKFYPNDCGLQEFISNGQKAQLGQFPHMAYIGELNEETGEFNGWCGGSLITPKYVLTAAHCLDVDFDGTYYVRLGELDWTTDKDNAVTQDIPVNRTIFPPAYDESLKYNDIILFELVHEAVLSKNVHPGCMTLANGDEHNNFIVAGWGSSPTTQKSNHLLYTTVERFDYNECNMRLDKDHNLARGILNRTQICAGSRHTKSDTCQGDSGGPLFRQHSIYPCMYELIGVTSFGPICGGNFPAVYTRIGLYRDWIEQVVWNTALHP